MNTIGSNSGRLHMPTRAERLLVTCQVVHCKRERYDVYVGRPFKWGNPFSHKQGTLAKYKVSNRQEAVEAYRKWITFGDGRHLLADLHELKGKTLGCWCAPLQCHGHVLSELVEKYC